MNNKKIYIGEKKIYSGNQFRVVNFAAARLLTSFGFREAVVQAEDDLFYKVLDVSGLRPSDENHPVVGEAFRCHFLSQLSSVAQLQLHLHCALSGDGQRQTNLMHEESFGML